MKTDSQTQHGKLYEEKGLPVMKKVPPMPKYFPQQPNAQQSTDAQTQQQQPKKV